MPLSLTDDSGFQPAHVRAHKKKYATRACDVCKHRKSRCEGGNPCYRCQCKGIDCTYNSSYNRVRGRFVAVKSVESSSHSLPSRHPASRRYESPVRGEKGTESLPEGILESSITAPLPRSLQDGHNQEQTGLGDASNMCFVRHIYNHLNSALASDVLSRAAFSQDEEQQKRKLEESIFLLPPREAADRYIGCCFDHSNATYRYLDRPHLENDLERLYRNDEDIIDDHSKVALLLMVMAAGCVWLPSLDGGSLQSARKTVSRLHAAAQRRLNKIDLASYPAIGTIQAYVTSCHVQLAMSEYNSAWIALGTAIRLAQRINLHQATSVNEPRMDYIRKGVFWSIFMLDRYMCILMGRPTAINENDISQDYPSPFQTEDCKFGKEESQLVPGVVAHIKLTEIIGRIKANLYPGRRSASLCGRDKIVSELAEQLHQWLDETPSFFHPHSVECIEDEGFYKVDWILQRQQKTVRNAFHFANMLLYRGYILQEVLERQPPAIPESIVQVKQPSEASRKCVDSALRVAKFAAEISEDKTYNAVYWCTSYFTLCSIAVLLVHLTFHQDVVDHQNIEFIVDRAMKGHEKLCHGAESQAHGVLKKLRHIATAARQAQMSMDLSNRVHNPGSQASEARAIDVPAAIPDPIFRMLDGYDYTTINADFQNIFFEELELEDLIGNRAPPDAMMDVGFGEYKIGDY